MTSWLSTGCGRNNLRMQVEIHRRQLSRRFHRLRRKVRCAIQAQRESAVISYLSARRFPRRSKEALILRLLAKSHMQRRKKLEIVLSRLSGTTRVKPRKWMLDWRCFYVLHAPRLWLLLWLKHQKDR
jgi:hypothetical protein